MPENQKIFKAVTAPTSIAAAQQFMDLSQEYLELVPQLVEQAIPMGQSVRSRTTKRVAALAVIMQRKFVTKGENTYIPGLLTRILDEHKQNMSPALKKKVRYFSHELTKALKDLDEANVVYGPNSESLKSTAALVPQIVYGRLVHSDYDKWKAGGSNPWFSASTSFLFAQDKFRLYIRMMRLCLIDLKEDGILTDLRYEADVHEDSFSPDGDILK